MILETIVVGPLQVNCYILACERTREALVIDPGDDVLAIQGVLKRDQLAARYLVATHAHFDHILAAGALHLATGAPFCLHAAERPGLAAVREATMAWLGIDSGRPPEVNMILTAGQHLQFGDEEVEIRLTPGHSPGGLTLVHHASRRAFTGDALFSGSVGRTDLAGGNPRTLLENIRDQIMSLPDDYVVLPGHGPKTTVGQERAHNPFLDPTAYGLWL
jgi:hydroxyacylglutathione hydrolase